MDERDERKLRLALSIISGRLTSSDFYDEWELMGYDSYKFSAYGEPSMDDVKEWAEGYIAECILLAQPG